MRFSSLLPMLLLLASPLAAQVNCNIFDLTASVVQFDSTTCEFYVVLDFQHTGTTNQFHVKGNGVDYGTFEYSQLPVTIGPLMSAPLAPFTFGFGVQDAVFQDCFDEVVLVVPPCSPMHNCDITDLTVDVGDCGPNLGTYTVKVDFHVTNPGNDFFEVYVAGGVSLGLFPLSALPLTIPNFPWGGGVHDVLKVCINDQPDCCANIEFLAPDCVTHHCGINDLFVNTGDCLSDSTYQAKIGFNLNNNISLTDSFTLYLDGSLYGVFGINQLPLSAVFETNGNQNAIVEVCVDLPLGLLCCLKKEFAIPACLSPCAIHDLKIETDTCTSDSTFGVWLNFQVTDSTAVDSFSLWGNGQSLGTYGMDQLPLNIPNFEWNGLIFNNVRVCTGNSPACCKELQFLAPDCLPFDTCEVTNIFVHTGECTSDSTYKLTLNFNATNPGNGTFIVWANGVLLDTFDLTEVPLMIPDFPWDGGNNDLITVCIGSDSSAVPGTTNVGCCKSKEFPVPDCIFPCNITDLHVEIGDCDPNTNTYPLTVNFNVSHPGNDSFDLYVNGQLYGTYPINQLPLHIPDYPSSGNAVDVIKVCINDQPNCCAITEFQTPACDQPCHIFDLNIMVGDCNPAGGFSLTVDFGVTNPGNDFFDLWVNGQVYGIYPLNQLPLTIPNFPNSGTGVEVIKICIHDHPDCCVTKEIHPPNCNDCEIVDLDVTTGDCNPDSTYQLTVNFSVVNSTATQFVLFGNGINLGTFNLSQLPLLLPNFPWDGTGPNDELKVCVLGSNVGALTCCKTIEFPIPGCLHGGNCEIVNLIVDTGACNPDSTYHLTLNFNVVNSTATQFVVFGNGINLGTFNLSQLPLHIPNFPWDGTGPNDLLKVCVGNINTPASCCKTIEFPIPDCLHGGLCDIHDLHVDTGDCNPDSTYHLLLNFNVTNPTSTQFVVFGNGINLGTFDLSQLPLQIPNFPWDGTGPNDLLKVCMGSSPGASDCCETIEFPIPACLHGGLCDIFDLHVETGNCTGDSTYQLTINFQVANAPANLFGVWANGQFLGMYGLGQLPLTIQDFPWDGGNNDNVKVCFATNLGGTTPCCETIEFPVPSCLLSTDCEIYDLVVDPGACTSDSTYYLVVNFQVHNPLGNTFGVWANGQMIGTFNLNQLPLTIQNFPWGGGNHDVVKVCFVSPNGAIGCCRTTEFAVPNCLLNSGNCEIFGMVVDPGSCTSDSTYNLFLNFQVQNPPGDMFGVWANGVFLGAFNLNQLPLNFPNFPWDGGLHDVVKVCFMTAGATTCCRTLEFNVPDCLGNTGDCHIYDLLAVRTGCLCGQFFVALTFSHENGSAGGYDVAGNGNNYGTFPYNHQQPIILGPFPGDGTTMYEFVVTDHNHPDCHDSYVLGEVECQSPVVEPSSPSKLILSPNPATDWLNVTAMLENGTDIGQATVKIYAADGRLVKSLIVNNAANFQLDISSVPAGVYRLSILGASGRLEGSFTKQH